jgi:Tc toxin complex TcA C-terminal TcB-binding domain
LHASAIAAQRAGDADKAKMLFNQAARTLKQASGAALNTGSPQGAAAEVDQPAAARSRVGSEAVTTFTPTRVALPRLDRGNLIKARLTTGALGSRDMKVLQPIASMDANTLTVRVPGRADGWAAVPALDDLQRKQQTKSWNVGVPIGEAVATFKVGSGAIPTANDLAASLYETRVTAATAALLDWPTINTSSIAFYLTQLYAHALPMKIADCYNQMGQFGKAEEYYLLVSHYTYLNSEAEATSLWIRMARNTVEWGDSLYKLENFDGAKTQYLKLILENATTPNSFIYTTASLAIPANAAKTLIQNITTRPLPAVNWEITYLVLTAFGRLQQIADGLDFFGLLLSPIHTFEYLQSVARAFAQEAIQAEREFVNFKSRQETEEATRRDLEMARAMAQAEADGRYQLYLSAQEDQAAAAAALSLAIKRRDDAVTQREQYAQASAAQIWSQAAAQAQGMGEDSWYGEISELADKLARGESISGPRGKLAAAYTLYAGRKTRDYELKKMQDNIDELTRGITIATDQHDAAVRRTLAAELAWEAAKQRAHMTSASLDAFDAEFFTPETWGKMADVMRDIAGNYLYRAIRIAKLMERAYNFENDTELRVIKSEYGQGVATPAPGRDVKLLGGDSLLQDIESFTYTAITTKTRKSSRIKDVISLASIFPAQFEQFRETGLLSFETDLYEFDRLHPGFYGQRIEAVEIEIIGLLPDTGLNGTLSAGGVTAFRKKDNTAGRRVHHVDTMALSSFLLRNDMFLYGTDTGVRGLFQGIGLATTWQLHLPKRSNDFDFRRIFDVNLIVYYNAKYDPALRTTVLALPPRPGEMALLRNFALRQDFPDAWYGFYRDGIADFQFERTRLPANQSNFTVKAMNFRVMTRPGVSSENIQVRVMAPNGSSGTVTTDAMGVVSTELPALAAIAGVDPMGAWRVEVLGGPSLMDEGTLKFDRVYNLQVGLEYNFEYVVEVL